MTESDPVEPLSFDPGAGSDEAFLLALSDAVGPEARPETILEVTARALGERLGADRVGYAEMDSTGEWLDIVADWHSERSFSLRGRQRPDPASPLVRAYRTGECVVFRGDETALLGHDRETLAAVGIAAAIGAPLIRDGRFDALMAVNQATPRDWTAREIALVEAVARRTWRALDHLRAVIRLRDSEAQFRTLAESTPSICWVSGPDGFAHWHNQRGHDYFGALGERIGDMNAVCHPDDLSRIRVAWPEALASGSPLEMTVRLRAADGTYRPFLSRAQPVRDDAGVLVRWCGVITDLSEQHAAEARRTFLMSLADRLRAETDVGVYIDITAEMLGLHLGVSRVCYSEIDPDDPRVFQVEREWTDGSVPGVVGRHRLEMLGDGLMTSHLRGDTLVVEDIDNHPLIGPDATPVLRALGFVAGIDTPLVKAGKLAAILHVHANAPRRWTEEEIALVKEVADRTWSGVERAKAEAHLEAQERDQRFLLALSDATRDVTDARGILNLTLAALGAHLGVSRANYAEADASGEALEVVQDWVDGVASVAGARFPLEALGAAVLADHLTGQPFRTDDIDADPRFDPDHLSTYRAVQVQAFISVPLTRSGRLTGVLSIQTASPRRWNDREVRLMQEVAERNWATLQRARSEERLRDSEEQFRTLAENLPNICFVTDAEGRMLWENWAFHAFFGENSGLNDRSDIPKVVAGPDVARADAGWGQALASGEPFNLRASLTGVAGRATPFLTQTRPVRDSQGRIVRWCGVMTDLSEEEAREDRQAFLFDLAEQLREARDPQRMLIETSERVGLRLGADRVHFAELDGDDHLTVQGGWAAPGAEAHVGRHDFRIFGEQALASHRTGRTMVVPDIEKAIQEPVAREAFHNYGIGSGVTVPLLRDGALVGFFSVQNVEPREWEQADVDLIRDVAERGWATWNRANAEAALVRSKAALAQSEKLTALGSLLAGVSHELNNPLSIIVAQSVMLQRQAEGSVLAQRAEKIRAAADRCARIVQTFLAMARQRPPEREAVDLNEIAGAALDLTEYGLRAAGIAVVRDFTDESTALSADGDQLHQVILNLITNAQQAMDDQPGDRRLTLTTRRAGDEVVLEVADTGPGVPSDLAARIFEPFFTTKPQGEGTGFGLSFSHGIVAAHDGVLELADHACAGAVFRLRLAAAPETPPARAHAAAIGSRGRRTALVIDDELEIAESLADLLDLAGFDCEVAHGGRAARDRLSKDAAFHLILSDLRMPDIDGPALFDWIRAERPEMIERVAFATGDTLGGNAAQFLASARRPHIEKPVTPESLETLLTHMGLEAAR